ncbi:BMP family lipoprotein [Pararhizobium mangrovi]|uniref:BMP family ABC transporter substrate-binding protein n=1 Tax=Pararhizobium mangrovi TaxID=2590452 RepID=A0A506UH87_9HYPH|nr:BMP family ABC transporter substrate-binding protein [Pararhizobium mangrovi]TPW32657.1 BMP family ABC transporter substrate-binding protein [Pararhizobium mangrovi]
MKRLLLTAVALAALSAGAVAKDFKPAVIYDMGGKNDKSFNEAAYNGAQKFKKETGVDFRDFEIANDAQREQALRRFARDGDNPIVVVGFSWANAIQSVAPKYPDTDFVIIDATVDAKNVRSVTFAEPEGSYLAGIMAAMASKTHTVGFIGGMDVPLIRKFECGYIGGVKHADKDAKVLTAMTGTTPDAWNDPVKAGEIAKSQMDQSADVIYAAAGGSGTGVLQATADASKLAIGVDSNQNYMQPGHVLTSMVKRVDVAVEQAFKDEQQAVKDDGKSFKTGEQHLGLADNGVGVVFDKYNKDLVTDKMKQAVEEAKQKIISGDIKVHDYLTDDSCPYQSS